LIQALDFGYAPQAMMKFLLLALTAIVVVSIAFAQAPDGAAIYQRECSSCHTTPTPESRAPSLDNLRGRASDSIVTALTDGAMRLQGSRLTAAERRAVAEFLATRSTTGSAANAPAASGGQCAAPKPLSDPMAGARWNGWGSTVANARFQPTGGVAATDIPKLKLKWAFGFPNTTRSRAQPTIAGGRVFVANESGFVYSLDAASGCLHWSFKAESDVRSAVSIGPVKRADGARYAVYFADGRSNAYAVDAETGRVLWTRKVEDHASSRITGSPTLHDGRLYVPTTGVAEENSVGQAAYECCTFRGSVSALDASTGEPIWKTYTIQEAPKPRGKSTTGAQLWGPAGGGIWSSPTIDVARRAIYVATGNGYADPPQNTTDAVIAMDMATGKVRWVSQVLPKDNWGMGCGGRGNPSCPETVGPDYDFSASPAIATLANGRNLLVIPQKAGLGYALDPDKDGAIVWQYRFGRGSGIGGVWGAAVDGQNAYFATGDFNTPAPGGMHAVRLEDGQRVWNTPAQPALCANAAPAAPAPRGGPGAPGAGAPGGGFAGQGGPRGPGAPGAPGAGAPGGGFAGQGGPRGPGGPGIGVPPGGGFGGARGGGGGACSAAQSAAVTAVPGAVFSGSADGGMRAYSSADGSILWEFNTNREFETVNGVRANGGSMDLGGAVTAGGMLYFTSGNGGIVGRPGNVLLAFGLD
jgi:polyvinyl alcohol dehydrogenase (cytochrome)